MSNRFLAAFADCSLAGANPMRIDITRHHDFAAAQVRLEGTEAFRAESSAMAYVDDNIDVAVERLSFIDRIPPENGLLGQVKRLFASRSLLLSTFRIGEGDCGSVLLSPRGAATIRTMRLAEGQSWLCHASAFLGCGGRILLEPVPEGTGSLAGGSSLLCAIGPGTLALWSETEIVPIQVRDHFTIPADQWIGLDECLSAQIENRAFAPPLLHLAGVGQLLVQPPPRAADFSNRLGAISSTRNP